MIANNIPLVDWGTGTAFLVIFLVVSAAMILVVMNMMKGKNKDENDESSG